MRGPRVRRYIWPGKQMSSSQLNCAFAIVKFLMSGTVGEGSALGVAKLNQCTTAPARGRTEGLGLMVSTGVPT